MAAGVQWPTNDDSGAAVSTTAFAKDLLARTVEPIDTAAAAAVRAEKDYRSHYNQHFVAHVRAASLGGAEAALGMAQTGLDAVYSSFTFARSESALAMPLQQAMGNPLPCPFCAVVVQGTGALSEGIQIPYGGSALAGDHLLEQIERWVGAGTIEPSGGASLVSLLHHRDRWSPERLDQHVFVVLGAGAAMSPTVPLLKLGATVVGVDIDSRPAIWRELVQIARASPGRLILPLRTSDVSKPADEGFIDDDDYLCAHAGCNLLTDTPEIAAWLSAAEGFGITPDAGMTIGQYAYLDGASFVRIAIAQDAIAAAVRANRGSSVGLAYLATPTDVYARSIAARQSALDRWEHRPWWMRVPGTSLRPNQVGSVLSTCTEGDSYQFDIVDATVAQQGPNYLLAKRIQQWRAMMAWSEGAVVSANIAPSSFTNSVTKAVLLHAAFNGTQSFPPIEVFEPDTSNHVMAAALLFDIFFEDSFAHQGRKSRNVNPIFLWTENCWHGGTFLVIHQRSGIHRFGCLEML